MPTLTYQVGLGPGLNDYRATFSWEADGKTWAESLVLDDADNYTAVWQQIEARIAEVDEQINTTYEITCQDSTVLTWP